MIKDDNVTKFYRSCEMVPCSEECFLVFGGVRKKEKTAKTAASKLKIICHCQERGH